MILTAVVIGTAGVIFFIEVYLFVRSQDRRKLDFDDWTSREKTEQGGE